MTHRFRLAFLAAAAVSLPVSGGAATAAAGDDPIASIAKRKCHKSYKGACLKRNASDYDCASGSGDGPYYVNVAVRIKGSDPFGLDADGDGWGCES